jgi:N-acetylmuramoyl-L-alanine amidase
VKLSWLLSIGLGWGCLLATLPARAGEFVSWQFDANGKQLDFNTDAQVKPEAQMLANPGKLVILLPETKFNRPTHRQYIGRGLREMRIGYDPAVNATSVVFELEPGYTIDPQQVLIKARNDKQWLVQIPDPQLLRGAAPTGKLSVLDENGALVTSERQVTTTVVAGASASAPTPATPNPGGAPEPEIAALPRDSEATIAAGFPATISAIEVDRTYGRVIIRGSRQLTYSGLWDARSSTYRITIANARLASNLVLPQQAAVDLRVSATINAVYIDVRRFDRVPIGPAVQYYGGQILTLTYASPVVNRPAITSRPQPANRPVYRPSSPVDGRGVDSRVLVLIDPGHGGKDPGAIGPDGLREVEVIMPIARRVAAILESQGIRTRMTRTSDYFVGLDDRVEIADRLNATVFVSIHANSIEGRPDVNGLETYYYGQEGGKLADVVHRNILNTVTGKGFYIGDRNTRRARFLVLRKSSMPAILVETGYLTNDLEVARLRRDDYRAAQAEGIARGIIEYLRQNY